MDGVGGVVFDSRASLEIGEKFVLEVKFPPLPNRVLIKAEVVEKKRSPDRVVARFLSGEQAKRDFLVTMAASNERKLNGRRPAHRLHRRFPVELPVTWQVKGVELRHDGKIEDLSSGGMFVRTEWTPPVGTELKLTFHPRSSQERVCLVGRVTWVSQGLRAGGMGIRFRHRNGPEMRAVRKLVREIGHSGEVDLNAIFSNSTQ
jgi:Tfp pilus assembly protein PilZ